MAVDASGNLFIADQNDNRIRKVDTNGVITTVAGDGTQAIPAMAARPPTPTLIIPPAWPLTPPATCILRIGKNNGVRKVDTNGVITTVAGDGKPGYSGDGGRPPTPSCIIRFGCERGRSGNLFIADG